MTHDEADKWLEESAEKWRERARCDEQRYYSTFSDPHGQGRTHAFTSTREAYERYRAEQHRHSQGIYAEMREEAPQRTKRPLHYKSSIIYGDWELSAQILFSRRGEPVVENVLEIGHRAPN